MRAKVERERLTEAMRDLSKKVRLVGAQKFVDAEGDAEEKKSDNPQQPQLMSQQSQLSPADMQQSPLR